MIIRLTRGEALRFKRDTELFSQSKFSKKYSSTLTVQQMENKWFEEFEAKKKEQLEKRKSHENNKNNKNKNRAKTF